MKTILKLYKNGEVTKVKLFNTKAAAQKEGKKYLQDVHITKRVANKMQFTISKA